MDARHAKQVQLLLVLIRSLRKVELCRRDFVVLLGTQVPLHMKHQTTLTSAGILLRPAPPLIPGVPTADKLHVWKLTNYSQCVVLDADLLVLKPIDSLFGNLAELTVAHHPYDHLQAQCGVPVAARGIAAMIVMRPNLETYAALMSYLLRRFKAEQLLYSDQTGLMCFFGNRSRTMPCPFLYDVSMMSEQFLPKWKKNCRTYVRQHVLKNCLPDIPDGCRSIAKRPVCQATGMHITQNCMWPKVAPDAHAVHFKGNMKPWPSAASFHCRSLKYGMPGVRNAPGSQTQTALPPNELLIWNASIQLPGTLYLGACLSSTWRSPVYWARPGDGPILARKCCNSYVMMAAQWNALLGEETAR